MNTSTAGPTVAKDLKETNGRARDTHNSRVAKTGGDISRRRYVNISRDAMSGIQGG